MAATYIIAEAIPTLSNGLQKSRKTQSFLSTDVVAGYSILI